MGVVLLYRPNSLDRPPPGRQRIEPHWKEGSKEDRCRDKQMAFVSCFMRVHVLRFQDQPDPTLLSTKPTPALLLHPMCLHASQSQTRWQRVYVSTDARRPNHKSEAKVKALALPFLQRQSTIDKTTTYLPNVNCCGSLGPAQRKVHGP